MPDLSIAGYPKNLRAVSLTIASGASASEMFATQGDAILGLIMPAAWTAADIAYKSCISGNTRDLQQVYDAGGSPEKCVVSAGVNVAFPQGDVIFAPFLQLISVSTADDTTAVTQGGARTVIVLLGRFMS
jgi:hypothetical protein